VVRETLRVLAVVEGRAGLQLQFEEISVGAAEYLKSGNPLPESAFERMSGFDAILLGAMGLPDVRWPNGVEMTPQLDIRERLDLYCGLRPIYLFHPDDSPLRDRSTGDIDFVIVRESTEGLFSGRKEQLGDQATQAEDRMVITRKGAERVIRSAFVEARRRNRRHVTLVDKANVLTSMAFFRRVFDEVAEQYPDVATNRVYVDAASLYLVQKPELFDVIVTENMFGDILSDLAAALVGGMGMAPSGDIGDRYAVFQPSHGSAPDIAGQGIANPVATILSAAMMLQWLGSNLGSSNAIAGAGMIYSAVRTVFSDRSARTRDMGGRMSTTEMADAVIAAIA
jgi:3-isopropylmalate dehydrogenase